MSENITSTAKKNIVLSAGFIEEARWWWNSLTDAQKEANMYDFGCKTPEHTIFAYAILVMLNALGEVPSTVLYINGLGFLQVQYHGFGWNCKWIDVFNVLWSEN